MNPTGISVVATVHPAGAPHPSLVTAQRYADAATAAAYIEAAQQNREWWHSAYRTAQVSAEHTDRARALPDAWKLLALSEHWCGDAVNILPYFARLAESSPATLELRVLGRDANPDVMQAHLTGRSRSIPIVLVLNAQYLEHGWWGPRPAELQEQAMGEWWSLTKEDRRLRIRTWYARDRGGQTIEEIVRLLETLSRKD